MLRGWAHKAPTRPSDYLTNTSTILCPIPLKYFANMFVFILLFSLLPQPFFFISSCMYVLLCDRPPYLTLTLQDSCQKVPSFGSSFRSTPGRLQSLMVFPLFHSTSNYLQSQETSKGSEKLIIFIPKQKAKTKISI